MYLLLLVLGVAILAGGLSIIQYKDDSTRFLKAITVYMITLIFGGLLSWWPSVIIGFDNSYFLY